MRRRILRCRHGNVVHLNFSKRGDQSLGITRKQNPRRIGKRFAAARDRKLDEHRADWRKNGKHNGDDEKNLTRLVVPATPAAHAAEEKRPKNNIGDQGNYASQNRRNR